MSEYNFSGEIGLDASDYIANAEDAADATADIADEAENVQDSLVDVDPSGAAAGAGFAAAGTGAQGLLDDQQPLRESLGRTAVSMDTTRDEAEDMAQELSDATFPMEDAVATMDSLAQQGVESEDEMRDLALAADNLADATGTSAESVADNLGPAVAALDDDMSALEDDADAFTMAIRDSTLETEDLAQVMERSSEELDEMGLSSDETAGLIAEYADETGKSGTRAARDFQRAVSDADGDLEELKEETGLSEDVLEEWSDEVENSAGATDEYAEAANESLTTTDRLRARMDDAKMAAAGMIGPIDAVAPAMQTAGMAAMTMSTINFSAVIPSLTGVAAAAAPVAIPLAAIAATVGALGYAWSNNWLGIQDRTDDAIGTVRDAIGAFPGWLGDQRDRIEGHIDSVRESIPGNLEEAADLADDILRNWHPAGIIWDKRDEIMDALPSPSDWRERAEALVSSFVDGIRERIPDVSGAVDEMADTAGEYLPSSDAERGAFSRLTDAGEAVPETVGGAAAQNADALQSGMSEMTGAAGGGGASGGASGDTIRQALEGMALELSGTLDVDGDVATMDDVEARIRREGRRSRNRGIR